MPTTTTTPLEATGDPCGCDAHIRRLLAASGFPVPEGTRGFAVTVNVTYFDWRGHQQRRQVEINTRLARTQKQQAQECAAVAALGVAVPAPVPTPAPRRLARLVRGGPAAVLAARRPQTPAPGAGAGRPGTVPPARAAT